MSIRGAVGGLVAPTYPLYMDFSARQLISDQSKLTPDAALEELLNGNRRFAAGRITAHDKDLAVMRQRTIEKQKPFAAVLSCADSRVPVELVLDQSIGQVFVTRVAGNVATSEIIASLEYGAMIAGAKLILVIGHGSCGAVEAAIQGTQVPGEISALYPHIQPAVDQAGPNLEETTKANATIQAKLLRQSSTVLSGLIKEKKLRVVAAYYDIASGYMTVLE